MTKRHLSTMHAIRAKIFNKSELISTSLTTYLIGLITLVQSVLVVNFFGLEVRGYYVETILLCTIISGVFTAIYEGAVPYLPPVQRRIILVVLMSLAAGVVAIAEFMTETEQAIVILITINAVLIVYEASQILATISVSIPQHNFLRLVNYVGSLVIHASIIGFLFFSQDSIVEARTGALWLIGAWTATNVLTSSVAFILSLKQKTVVNVPGSTQHIFTSGVLFSIRPYFANLDKLLVARLFSHEILGAYTTTLSVMSLGGPIINALIQLSHHTERHAVTISSVAKKVGAALGVSLLLLPAFDFVLFAGKLHGYWYLAPFAGAAVFVLAIMKAAENISLKLDRNHGLLAIIKILALVGTYIILHFVTDPRMAFILVLAIVLPYTALCARNAYSNR